MVTPLREPSCDSATSRPDVSAGCRSGTREGARNVKISRATRERERVKKSGGR